MKISKVFFVFNLLLFLSEANPSLSQQSAFTFVPPPGGSFNGSVRCITQDAQGYMWIAADGLHRYDGYQYKSYFNNPLDSNSLAMNQLETICVDRNGNIWVGTKGAGLDRLDPQTGKFTHYRNKPGDRNSLSNDYITAILEDRDGDIWVGTEHGGLNRLDKKTQRFQHYRHQPGDTSSLINDEVWVLYQDREGILWVGTGTYYQELGEGGLNRLDKKTSKIISYVHDPKNPQSLINNKVRAIFEDSRGTFWVGTAGDGLHTMDRNTGNFVRHRYNPAQPESLSRPPLKKVAPWADDCINFIKEDGEGNIWIVTFSGGLNRYDPSTKKSKHFSSIDDSLKNVSFKTTLYSAWVSTDGVLWIGTFSSVFRLDPFRKNIPYYSVKEPVRCIFQDLSGTVWLGTENGLRQYDRNLGITRRFMEAPKQNNPKIKVVNVVYQDRAGTLWAGTLNEGLFPYNHKAGNRSIREISAYCIHEDKVGRFWIGNGAGLVLFDRQTKNHKKRNRLTSNEVSFIEEDNSANLWVGTSKGLHLFDPEKVSFKIFLPGKNIFSFCVDSEGVIWIGTSRGLYRSKPFTHEFSLFTDHESGISEDIVVQCLLEDNLKALWVRTSESFLKIGPDRKEIKAYGKSNGVNFQNYSTQTNCFKSKSGELFFGDLNGTGFYAFYPEQLTPNNKAPKIIFTDLLLNGRLVNPDKKGPLHLPLDQSKIVRLRYNQNVFSINFVGIHYGSPEDNRHIFMLENLDHGWRNAGNEKTAYYYNIPPGRYVFRVKVANSDGIWAEKTISVIINPPWWRTWWAYILFALLLGGLIYAFIQYRINKIRVHHEIALQKHKATELEMQALRAQMNPHFIFNSLNSINMFILENNKLQASEYLSKFSRLVRLILQNSQEAFIPLDKELEALRLYLELEALRFEQKFEYKISVSDEIDTTMIKVPPLIIQPYAENAIWHGLMHLPPEASGRQAGNKEKGHLEIDLNLNEKILYCKITDDGVGRKRAAELKSKSSLTYESMGMRITADRIAILQQQEQNSTFVSVKDLVFPDGRPGGTEVIIKIPVIY